MGNKIFRSTMLVMIWTVGYRILGFLRESLLYTGYKAGAWEREKNKLIFSHKSLLFKLEKDYKKNLLTQTLYLCS